MKKRFAGIFAAALMVFALLPMTALADDGFAITNGTSESAKETNHGYITIDKTTAAEGETVTITVNPNEGYQLKSLTATPVVQISTIADVLATVEGFPNSTSAAAPMDAWATDNKDKKAFTYLDNALALWAADHGTFLTILTTPVVENGNDYTASVTNGNWEFNMTDGVLTSFTYTHKEGKPERYDGTYAPASTPSAKLKPITPEKQTDGTYQFIMPDYAVTVTAEFEEVGGTGKTLPYSFDFETDMVAEGWTNIDADGDGQDWISGTNKYGDEGWGVAGSRCAISQSYENDNFEAFDADNWLFSPAITIPAGGATVSWYEKSQDPAYPDFYEVYVSETNTSTDTSKMKQIFSGTAANPWNQRSVELEAAEYAGKTVYIAFRHHCYDQYMLEIDDFAVEAVAPAHTHAFTYTANNGKITATCVDGCDDGYDTDPLTLTLTAPESLVYDGNAKGFTFADGEADAWTGAGLELPTITYAAKSGSTLTSDKAVDAGSYTVSVTVDTDKTASLDFEITKATPYIKTPPAPNEIEYGQKLADSTLFGGYVQVSSTDSTQIAGLFEWTEPNTVPAIADSEATLFDVTFTPADEKNYNTVSCQVTIKVNHTHSPEMVAGQAPTKTEPGWKDYYECICGERYEDAAGSILIPDLAVWKAEGGNGYIPPLAPTKFTVTFDMNGHGAQVAPQTVGEGGTATRPADPQAEGWTFGGWYADAAFSGKFDFGTVITADTIVYAKWAETPVPPASYKIIEGADSTWTKGSGIGAPFTSNAPFSKFVEVKVDGAIVDAANYTAEEGSTKVTFTAGYMETLDVGAHSLEIASTDGSASTRFNVKAAGQSDPKDPGNGIPDTGDNGRMLIWSMLMIAAAGALCAAYARHRMGRYHGKHDQR